MTSLSFPDVNIWLALLIADHTHRTAALEQFAFRGKIVLCP